MSYPVSNWVSDESVLLREGADLIANGGKCFIIDEWKNLSAHRGACLKCIARVAFSELQINWTGTRPAPAPAPSAARPPPANSERNWFRTVLHTNDSPDSFKLLNLTVSNIKYNYRVLATTTKWIYINIELINEYFLSL